MQLRETEGRFIRHAGEKWVLYQGDCVSVLQSFDPESIDLSVFSPPFSNLYVYSDFIEDMGNCANHDEFFTHFGFLIEHLYRITKTGRLCAVHCNDQTRQKGVDGVSGLYDFPGDIVRAFEAKGWVFHSRVCIWKDPVVEMQRTKNIGLLHKQLKKDSCASRMGRPDYVLVFRKWGTWTEANFPSPVPHDAQDFPVEQWQRWASPVWMDIRQGNVLQYEHAKGQDDERHICPLQLDVIERCLTLWSNPGDLILSPFAGIGSEGHQSIVMGRRFVGIELKPEYVEAAIRHLTSAEHSLNQTSLFGEQS